MNRENHVARGEDGRELHPYKLRRWETLEDVIPVWGFVWRKFVRPVWEPRDVKFLRLVDLDWGSLMDVIVFFTAASEGNCNCDSVLFILSLVLLLDSVLDGEVFVVPFSDVLLILGGHIY